MKFDITIKDMNEEDFSRFSQYMNSKEDMQSANVTLSTEEGLAELAGYDSDEDTVELQELEQSEPLQFSSDVELDAEGYPWDGRIHTGTKTKKANGTWNRKRNTPDETWDEVRLQLKASLTPPMPVQQEVAPVQQVEAAVPLTPPAPVQQVEAAVPLTPPAPVQQVEAAVPLTPPAPVQQVEAAVPLTPPAPVQQQVVPRDFNGLISLISAKGLQIEDVNKVLTYLNTAFNVQLSSLADIMGQQAMIESAFKFLETES